MPTPSNAATVANPYTAAAAAADAATNARSTLSQVGAQQPPPAGLTPEEYSQQRRAQPQPQRQQGRQGGDAGVPHSSCADDDANGHLRGEPNVGVGATGMNGMSGMGGSTSSNVLPDAFLDDIMTATQVRAPSLPCNPYLWLYLCLYSYLYLYCTF